MRARSRHGLSLPLRGLAALAAFTLVVDVLLLAQPLYMLQVYDRVLTSASVETLVLISVVAAGALLLLGFVDALRGIMAGRIAARLDVENGADALVASINGPRASLGDVQPLRDLATLRHFIASRAILAWFDLPFAPLFVGLLYIIHPHLFWLTVGGVVLLSLVALANQFACRHATADGGERAMGALLSAQVFARNGESIGAMGMVGNVIGSWGRDEAEALRAQERGNTLNSIFSGLSRVLRMGLQIAILGYGGYLVLAHEMTAGMIFASSLISGRGLQPIDQVIGGWKGFVDTAKAWRRLTAALKRLPDEAAATELPAPLGRLTLEQAVVFAGQPMPGVEPLLKRVSLDLPAGDCLAVIGPSGAGKSILARAVVGALRTHSGAVRLDMADIGNWSRERLGRHIGYLAQDVELLPGTIAENIARFDPAADDAAIVAAAKKAEVHELILALPKGYDTVIGPKGQQLSGGQRQRVGLARAFFGEPRLLVLDEPNANLDIVGDQALDRALAHAKADGVTVVIVTQRRAVVDRADRILMLRDGMVEDLGPRLEVMQRQMQRAKAAQPGAATGATEAPVIVGRFPGAVAGTAG